MLKRLCVLVPRGINYGEREKSAGEQPSINEHTCSRHLRIHPGMNRAQICQLGVRRWSVGELGGAGCNLAATGYYQALDSEARGNIIYTEIQTHVTNTQRKATESSPGHEISWLQRERTLQELSRQSSPTLHINPAKIPYFSLSTHD